jgi:hypothetical protein
MKEKATGVPLTQTIIHQTERARLPPEGIDLRAELVALQSARVRQALGQACGDYGKAARLLRMSRLDLVRLETQLAGDGTSLLAPPDPRGIPRIAGGVEFISAAAIRRYAAEGLDEKEIARTLGCNGFLVEKVLREQTEAEIVRLDSVEKLAPKAIALKLRIPISRVRRVLVAADLRLACAESKRGSE